jgi:hypothetical protein
LVGTSGVRWHRVTVADLSVVERITATSVADYKIGDNEGTLKSLRR